MSELTGNKLTAKQKKLVDTLVAKGCSIKDASKDAGYSEGEAGRVTASKTLKLPHVQQYMMSTIAENIGLNATKALQSIVKLVAMLNQSMCNWKQVKIYWIGLDTKQ